MNESMFLCRISIVYVLAVVFSLSIADAIDQTNEPVANDVWIIHGLGVLTNRQVANLVKEAQKYDPNYCYPAIPDREKAVMSYSQAMEVQPEDGVNASIARRVAQLYSFYDFPATSTEPDPELAEIWWRRAARISPTGSVIRAQTHMGLAGILTRKGDLVNAVETYRQVLDLDPSHIVIPEWWSGTYPDFAVAQSKSRSDAENIRCAAVQKLYVVWDNLDRQGVVTQLQAIVASEDGTPAGRFAHELVMRASWTSPTRPILHTNEKVEDSMRVRLNLLIVHSLAYPILATTLSLCWLLMIRYKR